MGMYLFELAQGSSMRLCLELEKSFPILQGWQLELMRHLWFVAYYSEIYYGVTGCEDAWLRTTVTLEDNNSSPIFAEESPEHNVMAGFTRQLADNPARQMHWSMPQELHRELTKRIKIHSNVLPCKAYREQLCQQQQYWRQPLWTWLLSLLGVVDTNSCLVPSKREFYPVEVLAEAEEEKKSVAEKAKEWRERGGTCVLATHLTCGNLSHGSEPRGNLRHVDQTEVYLSKDRGAALGVDGVDGCVCKVSWRNGIYARKAFHFEETFEKECLISSKGPVHPHVVHPFGHTTDTFGHRCLLMEVLSENLYAFATKMDFTQDETLQPHHDTGGVNQEDSVVYFKPHFSRADRLYVLLQIARGVEFLHKMDVVHGDLKPQNILISHFEISEDLRHFLVKVTDFGNAQFIIKDRFTPGGPGTTQYAAPELLKWRNQSTLKEKMLKDQETLWKKFELCEQGQKRETLQKQYKELETKVKQIEAQAVTFYHPKSIDAYSFGAVAFEVLTDQRVYNGTPITAEKKLQISRGMLRPNSESIQWQRMKITYPLELINCVERCWELDPSKRPTFSELCEVLQRYNSGARLLVADIKKIFLALCLIGFFCIMAYCRHQETIPCSASHHFHMCYCYR